MIISADISDTKFLNYLNSLEPHLKFSMKMEMQERLEFLFLTICKQNNKIITSWYRKSLNTLNFISFNFVGPKTHKMFNKKLK